MPLAVLATTAAGALPGPHSRVCFRGPVREFGMAHLACAASAEAFNLPMGGCWPGETRASGRCARIALLQIGYGFDPTSPPSSPIPSGPIAYMTASHDELVDMK